MSEEDGQDVTYVYFMLPLFLVEHKLAWYIFDLLSCAWGISLTVRKSLLFALSWVPQYEKSVTWLVKIVIPFLNISPY